MWFYIGQLCGLSVRASSAEDASGNFSGSIAIERDAALEQQVSSAERSAKSGDPMGLIALLEEPEFCESSALIERDGSFVRPISLLHQLLQNLPEPDRQRVRVLSRDLAQRAWEDAVLAQDPDLLKEVARVWRHTETGQRALREWAGIQLDRGNDWHARLALRRLGEIPRWSLPSSARNSGNGLNRERSTRLTDRARELARMVTTDLAEHGVRPFLTFGACTAGGLLIVSDVGALSGLDVSSGDEVWSVPRQQGSDVEGEPDGSDFGEPDSHASMLDRLYREAVTSGVSTDGARIYHIEPVQPAQGGQQDRSGRFPANLLVARSPATGETVWSWPSDEELFLSGPPLSVDGRVVLIAQENGREAPQLVVLTGQGAEVLRIDLVRSSVPFSEDPGRRERALPVVSDGELVWCPTGMGGLVACDLLWGRTIWAFRHSRDDARPLIPESTQANQNRFGHRNLNGWQSTQVFCQRGIVLYVTPEWNQITALRGRTGEVLWSLDRGDGLHVAHVDADVALIIGRQMARALRLDTGEELWRRDIPHAVGTGVTTETGGYRFPVDGGECEIDMRSGEITRIPPDPLLPEPHPTLLMEPHPGNLVQIAGGLVSVTPGEIRFESFNPELPAKATGSDSPSDEVDISAGEDTPREAARRLIRQWQSSGGDQDFGQIDDLLANPHDRAHWLKIRLESALTAGDSMAVARLCRDVTEPVWKIPVREGDRPGPP